MAVGLHSWLVEPKLDTVVAKSDPRRLLSSQELLVRCHPFLSCSPSPATRVPNTDHHDFPPKSINDLCKDTASIVIRGKARKNMYSTHLVNTVGRLLFQGPRICDQAGKEPPQASPSLMSRYLAVIMPKAETSMGIVINPAEHNDM